MSPRARPPSERAIIDLCKFQLSSFGSGYGASERESHYIKVNIGGAGGGSCPIRQHRRAGRDYLHQSWLLRNWNADFPQWWRLPWAGVLQSPNGADLRREPIEVRKATLGSILRQARHGVWLNEQLEHPEGAVFQHASGWKELSRRG
jgi:hypothetical protein